MLEAYFNTALSSTKQIYKRLALSTAVMSNKFALSDIKRYAQRYVSVVLVSWVDSAEIASLVEEISIYPVDGPLAQSVDSFCAGFNRALSFAVPRISTLRQPRHRGRTPKQDEGSLRQDRARHEFCPEKIMQDHQRQSPPAHREMLEWRRATHGSASLIRAIPSRLLEPECKDRSSRAVAIERCPQSTNCLLEANKAAWVTSDDPTDLTLELEDTNGEIPLR